MWDFVVLKHGHGSSQGVLISTILVMASTLQITLNHHLFARKLCNAVKSHFFLIM